MKENRPHLVGFEVDLLPALPWDIAGSPEKIKEFMQNIISALHASDKYITIPKRTWLNKNELFVYNSESDSLIAFSQDNHNIEITTLPFILKNKTIDTVIYYFFNNLVFAAQIFSDQNIRPDNVFLPVNSLHERITGWHINISNPAFEGRENLFFAFSRILPVFSMLINRNFHRYRSLRVKYLKGGHFEISDKEPCIPFSLPDRRSGRKNSVMLSVPSMDFPDMDRMKDLLQLLLLLTDYITDEKNTQKLLSGLLKYSDRQFCTLIKNVNTGNEQAADQLISIFTGSLSPDICNTLNLKDLKKPITNIKDDEYYKQFSLGSYLKKNLLFMKTIKPACAFDDIVYSLTLSPLRYYFNHAEPLQIVHDLDWEVATIKHNGELFRIPLNKICDRGFNANSYLSSLVNQYTDKFGITFHSDISGIKDQLHAILNGAVLEYNMSTSFNLYSDLSIEVLKFLSWLADEKKFPQSTHEPFGLSEDSFSTDIPVLIPLITVHLRFFFISLYLDNFSEFEFIKIRAAKHILNLFKKYSLHPAFDIETAQPGQKNVLLYEKKGLANASSLLSLQNFYFRYKDKSDSDDFIIDRGFLIAFFNQSV